MIETVTWKLGGRSNSSVTAAAFYIAERDTTVYSGNPTEWEGKIALMYPSDYGYATSGGAMCLNYILGDWDIYNSICYNNDWLYTGSIQWTLTPYSSVAVRVFTVRGSGEVYFDDPYYSHGIYPSLYLSSNVTITGGTGTESNPYTLSSN